MKNTSKILLSLVIVLALLLSVITITASAAGDTYTVAGVAGLCGSGWDVSDSTNDMTLDSESGIYVKTYSGIEAGNYEFKVVKNHSWSTCYPSGDNAWFTVPADKSDVTVIFNGTNDPFGFAVMTVAGESGLCVSGWDPSDATNDMTYDSKTGTFSKVYENVAAGSYKFKVVNGRDWNAAYPSNDKTVTVPANNCKVVITFNPFTKAVDATVYTVVNTLDELNAALANGGNIILNADITSSEIIVIGKATNLVGNGHTITSTAARAINISGANGVTIKDLKVVASGERAFNVIQSATNVVIDNVTATAANYTVNVASSAANAVVTVKNSDLTGLNVVNLAAANVNVTVTDTKLTCNDQTESENYAAIVLGTECENAVVTATNIEFVIKGDSVKAVNSTLNGDVTIDGGYEGVVRNVAYISYGDNFYAFTTLEAAIEKAVAGDTVYVLSGTYAIPSMKAGITIEGVGEVLFEGTLSGTLENLTLKNLHIKGEHAQRWAYAKGDLVFDNVTFEATKTYALHFDGITEGTTLLYKDCDIIGWAAMGGSPASCVFDGCTFKGNGRYGVIRTYFDATIENCTFDVSNVNPDDVYQDGIHSVDATVTVNNCTNNNGDMKDIIDTSGAGYVVLDSETIHIHKHEAGETVAPTCTEAGYTVYTCPCSDTYTDEVEALGHTWVDADCDTPKSCSVCTATEGEALGHKDTGLDAKCDTCGQFFVPTSPFKLEVYQKNKGGTYYFKGSMSGYYFATTYKDSLSGAVDVYAEETDGGYYLYFLSGTTKNYLYIQINGTHTNIKYGSTKAVWAFNTTFGTFTTVVNGTTYYMGTYSTYVTISASKISYLSESNMDVSQFPARPVSLVDHVCEEFTEKVTAPKCTTQGYTTKTCKACGVATKVDYVDALGHDLVDVDGKPATCTEAGYTAYKDCSRCTYIEGKETIDALGHNMVAGEVVPPNFETDGYTIYNCANGCGLTENRDSVPALICIAMIGETKYDSLAKAIEAAVDGDVINVQAVTIEEEVVHSNNTTRFGGKSITIVGAENYGTVLKGGLRIGYDDAVAYTGSVTIKGIAFEGKGLSLVQLDSVSVIDCKFTNIHVTTENDHDDSAILVISDGFTKSATITGNVIDDADIGIRVRNALELLIDGNEVSNTNHNSITVENGADYVANAYPLTITNNTLKNWGLGTEKGRAIRVALGKTVMVRSGSTADAKVVTIANNILINENAPEEFIKMTDVDSSMDVTVASNVLSGNVPEGLEFILLEGNGAGNVDTTNNPNVADNQPHILDGNWWIGTTDTGVKAEGVDGESITVVSVLKTSTEGNVDTYTITFSNGYTATFTVTNGVDGEDGKDGVDGEDGKDGVDGEDGKDGVDGEDGKDGVDGKDGKDGNDGKDGVDGKDGNDNNQVVITAITVATVAIIFALAVLLFWRVRRRSWWCFR